MDAEIFNYLKESSKAESVAVIEDSCSLSRCLIFRYPKKTVKIEIGDDFSFAPDTVERLGKKALGLLNA